MRLMLYFPFSRHLSKYKSDIPFEEKQLVPPKAKPSLARTKNGYLWYAEHRTFGTTWMRLYFCITKGILVSPDVSGERERWGGGREATVRTISMFLFCALLFQSTTKAKLPISLHLNLCNVKVTQHHMYYNTVW